MDYQKLYHILFNAVTDSLENMAEQTSGRRPPACGRPSRPARSCTWTGKKAPRNKKSAGTPAL